MEVYRLMPVRAKVEEWLYRELVGTQWFQSGECMSMPQDDFDAVTDYASDLYHELIERIDWKRVLLEASGRCSAFEHDHEGPCAESVERALLCFDRPFYGEKDGTYGWADADKNADVWRTPQPVRWNMPKELVPMFAAYVRAIRKSKQAKLEEEQANGAV